MFQDENENNYDMKYLSLILSFSETSLRFGRLELTIADWLRWYESFPLFPSNASALAAGLISEETASNDACVDEHAFNRNHTLKLTKICVRSGIECIELIELLVKDYPPNGPLAQYIYTVG
jgi:hypothetical protein